MSEFYIGCRLSEIEAVYPNDGGNKGEYPTRIRFKSGNTLTVSDGYHEAMRRIEFLLAQNENAKRDAEAELIRFRHQKSELEAEIASLATTADALRADLPEDIVTIAKWLAQPGRPYMRLDERQALARLMAVTP